MKRITISLDEDLWARIKKVAAAEHKSMSALIRDTLASGLHGENTTAGERVIAIAREVGPAPQSWKWNREQLYDEILSEKTTDPR